MRICLVTPYDLTHDSGVNTHVRSLADMLRQAGHHAEILGPASGSVPRGCHGLRGTVSIPANGSRARVGLFVLPGAVAKYLTRGHFDVVHVHEPYVPGPARAAVRCATAPVVATFHAYAERERTVSRVARRVMARPLYRVTSAIAASAAAADFARIVYDGAIEVIPNGIDVAKFSRSSELQTSNMGGIGSAPLRLLFVGRHDEPRKGLAYFLEAAARMRAAGRHLDVQIVGRGVPNSATAAMAARSGAQFRGRLDDTGLIAAYRNCDIFCAPSIHGESFGLVLLEAMACGRPVVASDIRGYREAAGGEALLVAPADAGQLAGALSRVADDQALRASMIKGGLRRAAALDWSRMAERVMAVYRRALAPSAADNARLTADCA